MVQGDVAEAAPIGSLVPVRDLVQGVAADVASFQLGPSHVGPDRLESGCAPIIGDRPATMSGSSRIEAQSRELRSERLGLLRFSIP